MRAKRPASQPFARNSQRIAEKDRIRAAVIRDPRGHGQRHAHGVVVLGVAWSSRIAKSGTGLVAAYAEVVASLGLLSTERALVLPNGEFFPDVFTADEASVQRMLDRLLEHAGLSDMALVVRFWGESAASCGTGACGSCGPTQADPESESVQRLVDAGEHWQVNVLPAEVGSPVALGSALCHAVALAVLREADTPPDICSWI